MGVEVGKLLGLLEVVAISIDLLSNKFAPAVPTLSTVANAIVLAVFVFPAFAVAVVVALTAVVFTAVVFTGGGVGAADLLALLLSTWDVVVVDLLALAAGEGTGTGGGAADLPDFASSRFFSIPVSLLAQATPAAERIRYAMAVSLIGFMVGESDTLNLLHEG